MIVYLVRNLSRNLPISIPFHEKELIFLDRDKAVAQYKEWTEKDIFGFSNAFGIASKVGVRSMSDCGEKYADIMAIEVVE